MHVAVPEAIDRLQAGEVVAIPTDTVYGLAADFRQPEAVARLYALKQRDRTNPLLLLAADLGQVERHVLTLPKGFYELADAFWPGALTLVIPADTGTVPEFVRAGRPTVGFRIPDHPLTLQLLNECGPIAATSANLADEPPATTSSQVEECFGDELPLLLGGRCEEGVASTILLANAGTWTCTRVGSLSPADIGEVLGYTPEVLDV